MSPYVRTVRTASGATAVQIVYSSRKGARSMLHVGSAHDEAELELLMAVARQRLAAGQDELDLSLSDQYRESAPCTEGFAAQSLWRAIADHGDADGSLVGRPRARVPAARVRARRWRGHRVPGPGPGADHRAGLEAGHAPGAGGGRGRLRVVSTIKRRLRTYAQDAWRTKLARACALHAGLGPATLVLYDVTTLYFETDTADGFRESGFSKERRLEPQITVGLLTDAAGFPLLVNAFEGNKAETSTIIPVVKQFAALHGLADVTVVADAGLMSDGNVKAIEAPGCRSSWAPGSPASPTP